MFVNSSFLEVFLTVRLPCKLRRKTMHTTRSTTTGRIYVSLFFKSHSICAELLVDPAGVILYNYCSKTRILCRREPINRLTEEGREPMASGLEAATHPEEEF